MKTHCVRGPFKLMLALCVGWLPLASTDEGLEDSATGLAAQPDFVKDFLQAIPTAWDETKAIAGEPGHLAIIARRSGKTWYVGGINGTDKVVDEMLDLSFVVKGKWHVSLIADSSEPKASTHKEINATADERISVKLSPRGGFAAKITLSPPVP